MEEIKELEKRLELVLKELEGCVEQSIEIRNQSPGVGKVVGESWETFMARFLGYIKLRERETGRNMLEGISLGKVIKYLF